MRHTKAFLKMREEIKGFRRCCDERFYMGFIWALKVHGKIKNSEYFNLVDILDKS